MKTEKKQQIIDNLKSYFSSPAVNKTGFCAESGVSHRNLNRVLHDGQTPTKKFLSKALPALAKQAERIELIIINATKKNNHGK